jgi:hypothetical protein
MRKCNDEIYKLAKDQALVKKLKKKKDLGLFVYALRLIAIFLLYFNISFDVVVLHFRRLFIIFVCLHRIVNTCFRSDIV